MLITIMRWMGKTTGNLNFKSRQLLKNVIVRNTAIFSRAIADLSSQLPKNSVIIMDKASYHNRYSATNRIHTSLLI